MPRRRRRRSSRSRRRTTGSCSSRGRSRPTSRPASTPTWRPSRRPRRPTAWRGSQQRGFRLSVVHAVGSDRYTESSDRLRDVVVGWIDALDPAVVGADTITAIRSNYVFKTAAKGKTHMEVMGDGNFAGAIAMLPLSTVTGAKQAAAADRPEGATDGRRAVGRRQPGHRTRAATVTRSRCSATTPPSTTPPSSPPSTSGARSRAAWRATRASATSSSTRSDRSPGPTRTTPACGRCRSSVGRPPSMRARWGPSWPAPSRC